MPTTGSKTKPTFWTLAVTLGATAALAIAPATIGSGEWPPTTTSSTTSTTSRSSVRIARIRGKKGLAQTVIVKREQTVRRREETQASGSSDTAHAVAARLIACLAEATLDRTTHATGTTSRLIRCAAGV